MGLPSRRRERARRYAEVDARFDDAVFERVSRGAALERATARVRVSRSRGLRRPRESLSQGLRARRRSRRRPRRPARRRAPTRPRPSSPAATPSAAPSAPAISCAPATWCAPASPSPRAVACRTAGGACRGGGACTCNAVCTCQGVSLHLPVRPACSCQVAALLTPRASHHADRPPTDHMPPGLRRLGRRSSADPREHWPRPGAAQGAAKHPYNLGCEALAAGDIAQATKLFKAGASSWTRPTPTPSTTWPCATSRPATTAEALPLLQKVLRLNKVTEAPTSISAPTTSSRARRTRPSRLRVERRTLPRPRSARASRRPRCTTSV